MFESLKQKRFLKVEKLSEREYYAMLTPDGNLLYKGSDMRIIFDNNRIVISKIRGEFIKDFDLKLEVFEMIKILERKHV